MRPAALASGIYFGQAREQRVAGALTLCRTLYAPHERIPVHAHDAAYLCLALEGSFRERSGEVEEDVVAGAVVLHRPGERHGDRFGARAASCLNVAFDPELAGPAAERLDTEGPALYAPPGALGPLVRRFAREFEQEDDASVLTLEGLTLELLAFFVRDERRAERRPPTRMSGTLERLRGPERVSLAALARAAGVHPSTLARAFRRFQGCSLGAYRRSWRVARACDALRSTRASLAEIAVACGYVDQSHLTRALRVETGLTPAAYRRATRG